MDNTKNRPSLEDEIAMALNRHSAENASNTPDFILAAYLIACLEAWNRTSVAREAWYGTSLKIGGPETTIAPEHAFACAKWVWDGPQGEKFTTPLWAPHAPCTCGRSESPVSVAAVDPSAADPGTPTPREKGI